MVCWATLWSQVGCLLTMYESRSRASSTHLLSLLLKPSPSLSHSTLSWGSLRWYGIVFWLVECPGCLLTWRWPTASVPCWTLCCCSNHTDHSPTRTPSSLTSSHGRISGSLTPHRSCWTPTAWISPPLTSWPSRSSQFYNSALLFTMQ